MPSKVEGVCDVCGGKTIQRSDDNPETVQSRLDTYRKNTAPLIDFYAARGLIVEGNNNVSSETCIKEIEDGLAKLGL
jgi:adenylate kinase